MAAGVSAGELQSLTGQILDGRYRVGERIGKGGMGAVYRAEHISLGRECAVKVLLPKYTSDETAVRRFRREARAACRVNHENVVEIYDTGQTPEGLGYIAMEYLRGEDLAVMLARERRVPWSRLRNMALQLCSALAAAHAQGVVHRDMKPENCIRVHRHGDPDFMKILDFGIAKLISTEQDATTRLTATDSVIGTYSYMSYEQVCGIPCDHRIDIWAMGVIIYEMLTGVLPFRGSNSGQIWSSIVQSDPAPMSNVAPQAGIPHALEAIVRKALSKDRDARYGDMEAFAAALASVDSDARPLPSSANRLPSGGFHPFSDSRAETALAAQALPPTAGENIDPHAATEHRASSPRRDTGEDAPQITKTPTDPSTTVSRPHEAKFTATDHVEPPLERPPAPPAPRRRAGSLVAVLSLASVALVLTGVLVVQLTTDAQQDAPKASPTVARTERAQSSPIEPTPTPAVAPAVGATEATEATEAIEAIEATEAPDDEDDAESAVEDDEPSADEVETTRVASRQTSASKSKSQRKKTVKKASPPDGEKSVASFRALVHARLREINASQGKRCLQTKGLPGDKLKVTVKVAKTGALVSALPEKFSRGSPLANCIVDAIKRADFGKGGDADVTVTHTFK